MLLQCGEEEVDFEKLFIQARGAEVVKWTEMWASEPDSDGKSKPFKRTVNNTELFFDKKMIFGELKIAAAGSKHAFNFEFQLPLVSSNERKVGSSFFAESNESIHWAL